MMRHENRMARGGPVGRTVAILLGVALLCGCGNLTSGGFGDVEVEIVSDTLALASAATPIEGTLILELQLFLQSGIREVELTDGSQLIEFPLDGSAPALLIAQSVRAGAYSGGRMVFRRVAAEVEGGLVVGGEPFEGLAEVALPPAGEISLPWEADFVLPEDGAVSLLLEMRASRWLRLLNQESGVVTRGNFEANPPRLRPAL